MIRISSRAFIREEEIEFRAVRSQGSGGQHVNKVSTAIHLFFDIKASSLPEEYKKRLLSLNDHRITKEGVIVIKAQEARTQEANKEAALRRLKEMISEAVSVRKTRRPTRPTRASKERRLRSKSQRSRTKSYRSRVRDE